MLKDQWILFYSDNQDLPCLSDFAFKSTTYAFLLDNERILRML